MIKVNINEAKTQLSALVKAVEEKGEIVALCRNGKPVAHLVKPKVAKGKQGRMKMIPELKGRILYDPNEPLEPEEWPLI